MIFVGLHAAPRFLGGVFLADAVTRTHFIDLSQYPQWLVVLAGTLVVALILWILIKVLKWALWLLLFGVLIGGIAWSGYLLVG